MRSRSSTIVGDPSPEAKSGVGPAPSRGSSRSVSLPPGRSRAPGLGGGGCPEPEKGAAPATIATISHCARRFGRNPTRRAAHRPGARPRCAVSGSARRRASPSSESSAGSRVKAHEHHRDPDRKSGPSHCVDCRLATAEPASPPSPSLPKRRSLGALAQRRRSAEGGRATPRCELLAIAVDEQQRVIGDRRRRRAPAAGTFPRC